MPGHNVARPLRSPRGCGHSRVVTRSRPARLHGARALAALALAAVLFAMAAVGGTVFVWCAPMAKAMLHTCCPAAHERVDAVEQPCCEGHRIDAMPDFASGFVATPWIAPPPLVAVLALFLLYAVRGARPESPRRRRTWPARAGPRTPLFLRVLSLRN